MFTRQFTRPFQATIAAGVLSALFAAAPAQALDQSAWLQEQLVSTDGASSVSNVPSGNTGRSYEADTQSVWLQGQLAITDGSSPYIRGDAEPVYASASSPSDGTRFDKQFAFVEHGLRTTDGSNM